MIKLENIEIHAISGSNTFVIGDKTYKGIKTIIEHLVSLGFTEEEATQIVIEVKQKRDES